MTTFRVDGRSLRLRRILRPDGRTLVVPLDHALALGPAGALADPAGVVATAVAGGADAVMLRPGLLRALAVPGAERLGNILMLTGRLTTGLDHVGLNTVEHAATLGADAVGTEFKFGTPGDLANVALIARLAEEAHALGLPMLVIVYTQPGIVAERGPGAYAHACRVAEEVGADIIKTALPDDDAVIAEAVGCVGVPIVVAGGESRPRAELARTLAHALDLGVAGAAVGRNAWGGDDPVGTVAALAATVHGPAATATAPVPAPAGDGAQVAGVPG
jgi:DhnA family fructose-bisphosphate aldolase class Ia